MLLGCTVHPNAGAARAAILTASPFGIGSGPGNPRHTGHTCVLGGAPNAVEQPQNIFDLVRSCTWVSRPITVSQPALITPRPSPGPRARARMRLRSFHLREMPDR